jgi:hypothetical protein
MSEIPVQENLTQVAETPNLSMWSLQPGLHVNPGHTYYGRVVIEAWANDESLAVMGERALIGKALDALKGDFVSVATTPWTTEAITATGNSLEGRVIVEIWDNTTFVHSQGADTELTLARARARLQMTIDR